MSYMWLHVLSKPRNEVHQPHNNHTTNFNNTCNQPMYSTLI